MFGIEARIWNRIAEKEPLRTQFGREMFVLDQRKLQERLVERERRYAERGVPRAVANALHTVAPLLWENEAISRFSREHESFHGILLNIVTIKEAVLVADQDSNLSQANQKLLASMLRHPAAAAWDALNAREPKPTANLDVTSSSARVAARELADALVEANPQKAAAKRCVVQVRFDPARQILILEEAAHALFGSDIAEGGAGPFNLQVDGKALGRIAAAQPAASTLELIAASGTLEIRCGRMVSQLPRLEKGRGAVARKPMRIDRRHKGKVEPKPEEGRRYAPKGDTWAFSAQVPFSDEAIAADEAENQRVSLRANLPAASSKESGQDGTKS